MTITVNLSPETERRLKERAAWSGQTLEAYLLQLAESAAHEHETTSAAEHALSALTPEKWSEAWRAWARGHATLPTVADDSRDSIYAGRGE